MTTTTALAPTAPTATTAVTAPRVVPAPIPFTRLVRVELAKMLNTRAGWWLLVTIAATGVLATGAVVLLAPDRLLTYDTFGSAIGVPMTVLLPVMAVLSVTSEWSQRSGLTTFTLVPRRGRVIAAKALVAMGLGLVSIAVALGIGAVGNLLGAAVAGIDPVWDISVGQMGGLFLANVLNLLVGFTLGVLIRNSPAAIVGFFVYSFVLPTLSMVLAASQPWWDHARAWLDFNYAQGALYSGVSPLQWVQLGVAALLWVFAPLAAGLWAVSRAEVK